MSDPHSTALTDKQNVMHTFSRHFKSTEKTNRSTSNCPCSSGNTKHIDTQHSQRHKIKRLKSRKERAEGGWKSRSHHHHRHQQSGKETDNCHGFCQSYSRCHPRRDGAFARVFPAAQEPSIITDNRLIGHHGLFNHEVKSIDIERLLSEQRKLENLGQHGGQKKNSIAPPLLTSTLLTSTLLPSSPWQDSGEFDVPNNNDEEAPYKGKPESATSTTKAQKLDKCRTDLKSRACKCSCGDSQEDVGRTNASMQVCQEEENLASHSNSQESAITPGQRQTHQRSLTLSESNVVMLSSTDSPSHVVATTSKESRPVVPETDRQSQHSLSEANGNERAKGQFNVLSLEQTPQIHGPPLLHPHSQPGRPSPDQTESSPSASALGSETRGNQQTAPVSALAARLCKSLELPLLRRRHLVAESREVLLQALRERHGLQLQENLLMVQRHLSVGTGPSRAGQGTSRVPASVDAVAVGPAAPFDSGFGVGGVEQLCLDSQRTATHKRRRKQRCPLRVTPPQPAVPWSTSPSVEQVGELLMPPSSSQFLMDFQPSDALSSHHIFTPPPASHWGAQAGPLQPWDRGFNRGTMKHTSGVDLFENWRHDPDLSFLNQTEEAVRERGNRGPFSDERSRQPLLQYSSGPSDGHNSDFSHLTQQQQDPFELQRSHFDASLFAPAYHPQDSRRLQPFYRFNHPPTSPIPIPRPHHPPDMTYYPPSHMLERGHSPRLPPQPALLSPEQWSFPPMRLY